MKLPDDLQVLILQILESCDVPLKEERLNSIRFPLKTLAVNAFPDIPIVTDKDNRDLAYTKEMSDQNLPPIINCGNQWIDGRHRVWALRKMEIKNVDCIGLKSFIRLYPFPPIAMINSNQAK